MLQNKKITVSIITPDGKAYENSDVRVLTAPSVLGQVSILPKHAPYFTKLSPGEIIVKSNGSSQTFAVFGGFMDVNVDGEITVMADFAQRSTEIDVKNAETAKKRAEELMKEKDKYSSDEYKRIEMSLKQALFAIQMANKHKRLPSQ